METRAADPDTVALLVDMALTPHHRSTGRRFTADEVRRICQATDEDNAAAKRLVDTERDLIQSSRGSPKARCRGTQSDRAAHERDQRSVVGEARPGTRLRRNHHPFGGS
jgi:hypothetical protein